MPFISQDAALSTQRHIFRRHSLVRVPLTSNPGRNGVVLPTSLDYTQPAYWGYRGWEILMNLDDLRQRLDTIDDQLLALLAERAQVILQVAAYKRQHDIPVYVPEREAFIIQRLRALAPRPLSADSVERIHRTIIEEMRNLEEKNFVQ